MTESIYNQYSNKYYNPIDNDKKPGDNDNWKSLQKGFYQIGHTQVETTEGLTLGTGTAGETSLSAAQLAAVKAGEFTTLTLGAGTEDETTLTVAQLKALLALLQ